MTSVAGINQKINEHLPTNLPKILPRYSVVKYLKEHPTKNFSTADRSFVRLTNSSLQETTPPMESFVYDFFDEVRAIKKGTKSITSLSFDYMDSVLEEIVPQNRYAVLAEALKIARSKDKKATPNAPALIEHLQEMMKGLKPAQFRSSQELRLPLHFEEPKAATWKKVLIGAAGAISLFVLATAAARLFTAQPRPSIPCQPRSELADGPNESHNPFNLSPQFRINSDAPRELVCPSSDAFALTIAPKNFPKPSKIPQPFLGQSFSLFQKTGEIVARQATSPAKSDTCSQRDCAVGDLFPLAVKNISQQMIERPLNQGSGEILADRSEDSRFYLFGNVALAFTSLLFLIYKRVVSEKTIQSGIKKIEDNILKIKEGNKTFFDSQLNALSSLRDGLRLEQEILRGSDEMKTRKKMTLLFTGASICSAWGFSGIFSKIFVSGALSLMSFRISSVYFRDYFRLKIIDKSIAMIESESSQISRCKMAVEREKTLKEFPQAATHHWDPFKGEWVPGSGYF